MLQRTAHNVFRNVIISESEFPEIKECLERLKKQKHFELDVVIIINDKMYIISCKGGKKEIPKMYLSRYWIYPSEREIITRFHENIEEAREVIEEALCLRKYKKIVKQTFNVNVREIIPVVVYTLPQPLAIEDFRKKIGITSDVLILTPSQLLQLIMK
ncbi:MAG: hypothetical protein ACTSXX_12425 [Candidatus Baldrarchaeia archaeon]